MATKEEWEDWLEEKAPLGLFNSDRYVTYEMLPDGVWLVMEHRPYDEERHRCLSLFRPFDKEAS